MANLTIIDGHNWLFRAFYGVPQAARTRSGVQVNAVYGFFAFLRLVVSAWPDNMVFVVFDSETGIAGKRDVRADYKHGRTYDVSMFEQLPLIKDILDLMGVKWAEHGGFEADDIIASLAAYWAGKNGNVCISSNDFDFVQLIGDCVSLVRSSQGKLVNCDEGFVRMKFGIHPARYVDYLSMTGDKSDNIAGVKGLGPKTAARLLVDYNDIEGIFKAADELPAVIQRKLAGSRDIILANQKFIAMKTDIPYAEFLPESSLLPVRADAVRQKIAVHLAKIGVA